MQPPAPPPEASVTTVTVYDQDGQPREVAGEQVGEALRAGFRVEADAQIPIRDDTGQVGFISGAEAVARAGSHTTEFASERDYARQEERKAFSGVGQQALTAGAGLVNSLGLGFGDAAVAGIGDLVGAGDDTRAWLRKSAEYNPAARLVGEGLGFVAPALLSGGTSAGAGLLARGAGAAGRGATAGARALTAAGVATEGAVARGLVRAGAAEGGLLARTLAPAAGQALELGVYGVGGEVSRAVVRNEALDGERLAAAFGHGALLGAGGGALLGGIGWAGGKGLDLAATGARRTASRGLDLARAGASRGFDLATTGASRGLDLAIAGAERISGRVSQRTGSSLEERLTRLLDTMAPGGLEGAAVDKALKSTGANQKIIGKAENLSPEVKGIAARQVRELSKELGRGEGTILSHVEQAQAAEKLVARTGEEIGQSLRTLDAQATARPNVRNIYDRARVEVLAELKSNPFTKSEASAVETLLKDLRDYAPNPTFTELHSIRRTLDRKIKFEQANPTLLTQAQRDVRRIIEDELTSAGERAAREVGEEFATRYVALKKEYTAAKWVEEATTKGAERDLANRTWGFSEQGGTNAGAQVGATVGATLGPVGAAAGSAVGGVAGGVVNHLVKKYGDQAAAAFLARAAQKDLVTAAAETVDKAVGKPVIDFFKQAGQQAKRAAEETAQKAKARVVQAGQRAGDVAGRAGRKAADVAGRARRGALAESQKQASERPSQRARFAEGRTAVHRAAAGGPERSAQVAAALAAKGASAGTARAAAATMERAVAHLRETMPRGAARGLRPDLDKSEPPPAEQAKWLKRLETATDPTTALRDLANGTLSREQVETLREVYPSLYGQVQELVMSQVAQLSEPLPYEQARRLSLLLDIAAAPTQTPAFIAAVQASYEQAAAPPEPPPGARRPINIAQAFSPDSEEA